MVPLAGFEPARLSALDFESSLSTCFNTVAIYTYLFYYIIHKKASKIYYFTIPKTIGRGSIISSTISNAFKTLSYAFCWLRPLE